jgi:hypothetical protein
VLGTLNVLEAARQHGTERMVHTSTSEVYGTALTMPIDESHPLQGQSPYSAPGRQRSVCDGAACAAACPRSNIVDYPLMVRGPIRLRKPWIALSIEIWTLRLALLEPWALPHGLCCSGGRTPAWLIKKIPAGPASFCQGARPERRISGTRRAASGKSKRYPFLSTASDSPADGLTPH